MPGLQYVYGAPASVISDFENLTSVLDSLSTESERFAILSSRVATLELLLSDEKMIYVWKTLDKFENLRNPSVLEKEKGFRRFWIEVWYAAQPALLARSNDKDNDTDNKVEEVGIDICAKQYLPETYKLTPAQRSKKQRELYDQFVHLAIEAEKYSIGINLLKYFSGAHFRGLQLTLANYALEADNAVIEGKLRELPELPKNRYSIAFKSCPTLSELLIGASADIASGLVFQNQGPGTPGRAKVAVNQFMESIGYHFLERYQKPMYQVIADTAATIFDIEALTKDQVPRLTG